MEPCQRGDWSAVRHMTVRFDDADAISHVEYTWVQMFDIEKRIPTTVTLTGPGCDGVFRIPVESAVTPSACYIVLRAVYTDGGDGYGLVTAKHFSNTYTETRGHKVKRISVLARAPLAWVILNTPPATAASRENAYPFTGDAFHGHQPEMLVSRIYAAVNRHVHNVFASSSIAPDCTEGDSLDSEVVSDTLSTLGAPLAFKVLHEQSRLTLDRLRDHGDRSEISTIPNPRSAPWGTCVLWQLDRDRDTVTRASVNQEMDLLPTVPSTDQWLRVRLTHVGLEVTRCSGGISIKDVIQAPYWAVILTALCCGALDRWSQELRKLHALLRVDHHLLSSEREKGESCQRCGYAYRVSPVVCEPEPKRVSAVLQIDKLLLGGICTTLCATISRNNGNERIVYGTESAEALTPQSRARGASQDGGGENSGKSGEKENRENMNQNEGDVHDRPSRDSSPRNAKREQEQTGSPLGGRVNSDVTGDKTKKEGKKQKQASNKDTDRDKSSSCTGVVQTVREKKQTKPTKMKKKKEEEDKKKKKKTNDNTKAKQGRIEIVEREMRTGACGRGKRIAETNDTRDLSTTERDKRATDTGSGSSTISRLDHSSGEGTKVVVDPLPQWGIGNNSHVKLLDIISKLFPLVIKVDSSTCSAAPDVSTTASDQRPLACGSLDDTLVAVQALENNFHELADWFETFESTKARDIIGFDLAIELCGCYDLTVRRLGAGLRDTFEACRFIQSTQQIKQADRVLENIETNQANHINELKDLLKKHSDTFDRTNHSRLTDLQGHIQRLLACDTANPSSASRLESLEREWGAVLEMRCILIQVIDDLCNQVVSLKTEYRQQENNLTCTRKEITRLQCERDEANRAVTKLEHRMTMLEMSKEDMENRYDKANTRKDTVQDLYRETENENNNLRKEIAEIEQMHEREKMILNCEFEKLQQQLTEHMVVSRKMRTENLKKQEASDRQIAALQKQERELMGVVSTLKAKIEEAQRQHNKEMTDVQNETEEMSQRLLHHKDCVERLKQVIVDHEIKDGESLAHIKDLTSEVYDLGDKNRQLLDFKTRLSKNLQRLFGDKKYNPENMIQEIRDRKDASVRRIENILKQNCVRVTMDGGNGDDDEYITSGNNNLWCQREDAMDVSDTTGDIFTEYESEIRAVVQSLSSEHIPMEVSGEKPVTLKASRRGTKRRNCEEYTGVAAEDRLAFKKPEYDVKPQFGVASEKKDPPRLDFESQANKWQDDERKGCQVITQQDKLRLSSVQELGHHTVHTFDIEPAKRVEIPMYIVEGLKDSEDVKIIHLGDTPVKKLLDVLQVEEPSRYNYTEIAQSSCHCLQMEQISRGLKCALFICWATSVEHEVYGTEHKNSLMIRVFGLLYGIALGRFGSADTA
ncbi:hypothetical protein D9C73_010121 [Collichthys lucidus]|uniref:Uncharacterized protein n=1 Tax=Collichthys lucidus TaxID=240159 RepID=A0A4U5UMP0_COLLU|nr:hypothetical protein D9C73_010121 [Collichthys lucidus]